MAITGHTFEVPSGDPCTIYGETANINYFLANPLDPDTISGPTNGAASNAPPRPTRNDTPAKTRRPPRSQPSPSAASSRSAAKSVIAPRAHRRPPGARHCSSLPLVS